MKREIKRLAGYADIKVHVTGPFSPAEIATRHIEYHTLPSKDFKFKYREYLYEPAHIEIDGTNHEIQMNFCCNPFCKNFGQAQAGSKKNGGKLRYKIVSAKNDKDPEKRRIECNDVPDPASHGITSAHATSVLSNWSLAEEIQRLIKINSIEQLKTEYDFHDENCPASTDPFNNPKDFYRRGKSTAGSQKYQCKDCKKITNVLPSVDQKFNYNQKSNAVLLALAKEYTSHTPIRRICEKLDIGVSTYYHKMEVLYKRSLEFLEEHETKAFKKLHLDEMMICTDALIYHLNNVKMKGKGNTFNSKYVEKKLPTYLIASADSHSCYVLRSDLAYDYDYDLSSLEIDTELYHCDRTYPFLRKNDRLRYSYFPKMPDTGKPSDLIYYNKNINDLNIRLNYVHGCHVVSTYTAAAQYFLIKQLVGAENWYVVSDDDSALKTAVFRIFKDELLSGSMHYFIAQFERDFSSDEALAAYNKSVQALKKWASQRGIGDKSVTYKAKKYFEEYFQSNDLYEYYPGTTFPKQSLGRITSPLSSKPEGKRYINFPMDISDLTNEDLASVLVKVSLFPVNNFFQALRRHISPLERPFKTSSKDGQSYIYANYNPLYAQYLSTIYRTYYNFCEKQNFFGEEMTPAQRIGLTDKVYKWEDIVYFK